MHPRQRLLLDSLIGNEGICLNVINNDNSTNLATKILYLERAINQDCDTFFLTLDKVYQPGLRGQDNLEFVLALKTIHTLRFNHLIKNEDGSEEQALNQYFGCLNANEISELEFTIYQIINQHIVTLKNHDEEIHLQIQERKVEEIKITEQTSWRVKLNLPEKQLIPHHMKSAIQSLDGVLTREQYLFLPPETQKLIAMCQNQTKQLIQEHGATFSQIQALPVSELDQLFDHLFGIGQLIKQVSITLTDLLALEHTMRIDLLENWFNVAWLIQKGNIKLADLVSLEPGVRAELIERPSAYLRVVDIGIPLMNLLELDKSLRTELINHPYTVKRLLRKVLKNPESLLTNQRQGVGLFNRIDSADREKQKPVSFEQLSQLASDLQAILSNPDSDMEDSLYSHDAMFTGLVR